MYTAETIRKYKEEMRAAIGQYDNFFDFGFGDILHVSISHGNSKIGNALNVSLPAIFTCGWQCHVCANICYDIKACLQYPNVLHARAINYAIMQHDRDRYFAEIQEAMNRRRKNKYLRFHVGGDIPDNNYFEHMVELARNNPDWRIWTYTKKYDIVNIWQKHNGTLPGNLVIMYSYWPGLTMDNPNNQPEFKVILKGQEKPQGHYCPGNCAACIANNSGCIGGQTTYCLEH